MISVTDGDMAIGATKAGLNTSDLHTKNRNVGLQWAQSHQNCKVEDEHRPGEVFELSSTVHLTSCICMIG